MLFPQADDRGVQGEETVFTLTQSELEKGIQLSNTLAQAIGRPKYGKAQLRIKVLDNGRPAGEGVLCCGH